LQVGIIHPTSLDDSGNVKSSLETARNTGPNPAPCLVPIDLAARIGVYRDGTLWKFTKAFHRV
jgi:hypothetical protein